MDPKLPPKQVNITSTGRQHVPPQVTTTLSAILIAILISGCMGNDDTGDLPEPAEDDPPGDGTYNGDPHDEQDGPEAPWKARNEHEGTVRTHSCIEDLMCGFVTSGDDTLELLFDNATLFDLHLILNWDEENSTGDERVMTIGCIEGDEGDCSSFPDPVRTTGGTPLAHAETDLAVPPNTTLTVTVSLESITPDPVSLRYDTVLDFVLSTEALLGPVQADTVD